MLLRGAVQLRGTWILILFAECDFVNVPGVVCWGLKLTLDKERRPLPAGAIPPRFSAEAEVVVPLPYSRRVFASSWLVAITAG